MFVEWTETQFEAGYSFFQRLTIQTPCRSDLLSMVPPSVVKLTCAPLDEAVNGFQLLFISCAFIWSSVLMLCSSNIRALHGKRNTEAELFRDCPVREA